MGSFRCRVALVCSVLGLAACGSRGTLNGVAEERCQPGAAACLSSQLGQICNQQGQWATFQCTQSQTCKDKSCIATAAPCTVGTTQCLSSQVGQVCDQQGQWATFACAGNQVCRDNACASVDASCVTGATQCLTTQTSQICGENGQWIAVACKAGESCTGGQCQGPCTANLRECVAELAQRICLGDGSGWVTSPCPKDVKCENGACSGSCTPGSKLCAATRMTRECRIDGSGYVEQECAAGTVCEKGECVLDAGAACAPGQDDTCRDQQTALSCRADGSGYEPKTCGKGTACQSGYCMGTTCAAGITSCTTNEVANLTAVQTCTDDGAGYTVSLCRAHEKCIYNAATKRNECYLPPCKQNESMCGDPVGTYSGTDRLSRCESLNNGKFGWVGYRCSAPTTCDVNDKGVAECHADCAPGDQRCTDSDNAIESCGEDGKWTKQSCDQLGSGIQTCLVVPTNQRVVCGDPDCGVLQSSLADYRKRGRCSSEKIRRCGVDGKLAAAAACDEGMCLPESDGFGACGDPNRCNEEEGWRECATANDAYRTCLSNHWEFTPCVAGQQCSDDGRGHAACGTECDPRTSRCSGKNYQICLANGTWGSPTPCGIGECNPATKRCETTCQPGEIRCAGDVSLASDGSSLGSVGMQACQANGSWGTTQACASGQYCRRSGNGVHLGCLECVGSQVIGGNEENAVDSRCSADGTGRQGCSSSNTWPATFTACSSGEQCIKLRDGTIKGSCSDDGCSGDYARRCVGFSTIATSETIGDCCGGDCQSDSGVCLHRRSQYDPTCLETTSCFTGRYDAEDNPISETCCSGYCVSGLGCLQIKEQPCATVTSCNVKTLGHSTVCCGDCRSDGSCATGREPEHPIGEYFTCGSSNSLCWSIGSCTWTPGGGVSGAMYANCRANSDGGVN
jgi:hypothetical protein